MAQLLFATTDLSAFVSTSGTLVGAAVGAFATWAGVRHHAIATDRLARERQEYERSCVARETELGVLLALQEAMTRMMEAAARFHDSEAPHIQEAGTRHGDGHAARRWNNDVFTAGVEVNKLRVRVRDEPTRKIVGEVQRHCANVTFAAEPEDARTALQCAAEQYDTANELLGNSIRELF